MLEPDKSIDFSEFISEIRTTAKRAFYKDNHVNPIVYIFSKDLRLRRFCPPGVNILPSGILSIEVPLSVFGSDEERDDFTRLLLYISYAFEVELLAVVHEAVMKIREVGAEDYDIPKEMLFFSFECRQNGSYQTKVYGYEIDGFDLDNRMLSKLCSFDERSFDITGLFSNILRPITP